MIVIPRIKLDKIQFTFYVSLCLLKFLSIFCIQNYYVSPILFKHSPSSLYQRNFHLQYSFIKHAANDCSLQQQRTFETCKCKTSQTKILCVPLLYITRERNQAIKNFLFRTGFSGDLYMLTSSELFEIKNSY